MVTDFDAWHPHHEVVDVAQVMQVMKANVALAKKFVLRLAKNFPRDHKTCPIGSDRALDNAIMTAPEKREVALLKKLNAVAARVL
jgi:5'-methylthioadenosine phosphorylase